MLISVAVDDYNYTLQLMGTQLSALAKLFQSYTYGKISLGMGSHRHLGFPARKIWFSGGKGISFIPPVKVMQLLWAAKWILAAILKNGRPLVLPSFSISPSEILKLHMCLYSNQHSKSSKFLDMSRAGSGLDHFLFFFLQLLTQQWSYLAT